MHEWDGASGAPMTPTLGQPRTSADVLASLRTVGVVPVIRAPSGELAPQVIGALVDAGLPVAEITMTVPDALEAIRVAALRFRGRVTLGAGTVTDGDTASRAIAAGAEFIVSPCVVPEVVEVTRAAGVTAIAGALTPTEIHAAIKAGADVVKIFPVSSLGGPSYIRALRGPFPHVQLIPTGGVSVDNAADFIHAGAMAVGVGSELISSGDLAKRDFASISAKAGQLIRAVAAAR